MLFTFLRNTVKRRGAVDNPYWLIVGLGNPGSKYARTRHNAGAWVLDELRTVWNFPEWSEEAQWKSLVSRGSVPETDKRVLLAFPQTFMNDSGDAVRLLLDFHRIPIDHFIVLHDEKETPFGETRIQRDRSAAGHNGVRSIIDALGTQDFWRVRLGIGIAEHQEPTDQFVLADFTEIEQQTLSSTVFPCVIKEIEDLVRDPGEEKF